MLDRNDRKPHPSYRDIVSTWAIAFLVILTLFGVSAIDTAAPPATGSDMHAAAESDSLEELRPPLTP